MDQSPASRPKKSRRYTAESQSVSDSVVLGVFQMPHGAGRPGTAPDPVVQEQNPADAEADTKADTEPQVSTTEKVAPDAPAAALLPERAAEDDPRRWGDGEDDLGEWLKSQRPPHWD